METDARRLIVLAAPRSWGGLQGDVINYKPPWTDGHQERRV